MSSSENTPPVCTPRRGSATGRHIGNSTPRLEWPRWNERIRHGEEVPSNDNDSDASREQGNGNGGGQNINFDQYEAVTR